MKEFDCSDPHVSTWGGMVDAFLSAFGPYRSRGENVVCRHLGVDRIDARSTTFYSFPKFLAAMSELQTCFGPAFMRRVGSLVFDHAVLPPGVDSASKAMNLVDRVYRTNHRSAEGPIGGYRVSSTGEGTALMVCDSPYPCAFDMGLLEAVAGRFAPSAGVWHVSASPCRFKGDDSCCYAIRWG